MDSSTKWVVAAFVMGLCVAYAIWGRAEPTESTWASAEATPAHRVETDSPVEKTSAAEPAKTTLPQVHTALKIDPPAVDLGEIHLNSSHSREINVTNTGAKTVKLTRVQPSCGCINAEMPVREIAPGKSEKLKITHVGTGATKRTDYSVSLTTDEQGAPEINVPIKLRIKYEFALEPRTINFDHLPKNGSKTIEASFSHNEFKPFKIKNIISTQDEFSFKWEPLDEKNPVVYKIFATIKGIHSGTVSDAAVIATDNVIEPIVPVFVAAEVDPGVQWHPAVLSAAESADSVEFRLELTRISPGDLGVSAVTESNGLPVTTETNATRPGVCTLKVKINADLTHRPKFGDLVIKTTGEEETLHIPYRLTLGEKKSQ